MRGTTQRLTTGERVAWYRRRRGLSQEVLAGLVGRTSDWLGKAENNRIELDRLSVIRTLAHALDVSIGDLIGEPTLLEWSKDSGRRTLPALREALMDYRQLAPLIGTPDAGEPPTLAALRSDVGEVWDAYQDSRYGFAARQLPSLLSDALLAARSCSGDEREEANGLLAMAYQGAALVLGKLGENELAWIAADRGLAAAQLSGNKVIIGSLFRSVTHCLLSAGASRRPRNSSRMRPASWNRASAHRHRRTCPSTGRCSSPGPWPRPSRRPSDGSGVPPGGGERRVPARRRRQPHVDGLRPDECGDPPRSRRRRAG